MTTLRQVDENRSGLGRSKRYPFDLQIVNEEYVGPRGGRRIPIEVVWKNHGTSFLADVWKDGSGAALFPYVRWHNGNDRPRCTYAPDWVKQVGQGEAEPRQDKVRDTHDGI